MIPFSLLLVLTSLGCLVAGLVEGSQPLVWVSLIASLGACGCLALSVLHRRRLALTGSSGQPVAQPIDFGLRASDPVAPAPTSPAPSVWTSPPDHPAAPMAAAPPPAPPPPVGFPPPAAAPEQPAAGPPDLTAPTADPVRSATAGDSGSSAPAAPADEPAVEDIPVADALRVAQLADEVRVVDGRPRYHLADCPAVAGRDTVPLPVSAARRAGFTPCAVCRPDATLLARSRSAARPPA